MSKKRETFVPVGTFDKTRVRISRPIKNSFTKNGKTITWYTSDGFYLDEEGHECTAYFELPEQYSFGFNPNYDLEVDEKDRTEEDLKGWQICYNLNSIKTVENPTEEEIHSRNMLEELHALAVEKFIEECSKPKKERKVPPASLGSYNNIMAEPEEDRDWDEGVKRLFSWPYKEGTKIPDKDKPPRSYIKLITSGSGRKLRVITDIRGPGGKKKSPNSYEGVRGQFHPVVKFAGLYWGQHGAENPQGCSVKLLLAQCNYTPGSDEGASKFFLEVTPAQEIEEDDDEETPPGDFDHPGGAPSGFEEGEGGKALEATEEDEEKEATEEDSEKEESEEEEVKPKASRPKKRSTRGGRKLKRKTNRS